MHLIISAWLLFALLIPVETVRVCLVFRRPAYHIIPWKLFYFSHDCDVWGCDKSCAWKWLECWSMRAFIHKQPFHAWAVVVWGSLPSPRRQSPAHSSWWCGSGTQGDAWTRLIRWSHSQAKASTRSVVVRDRSVLLWERTEFRKYDS